MPNIQYHGDSRTTQSCIDAIVRLLHFGDSIDLALMVTSDQYHAFLLTVNEYQKIVIQPGFASGYGGEGPKGLAKVIQLLRFHNVELEEVLVNSKLFSRIESCQLRERDLKEIEQLPYVRPLSWVDYLHDIGKVHDQVLQRVFPCEIPWSSLDPRLLDLAMQIKREDLSAVSQAFNRLETILKERCENLPKSLRGAANQVFSNGAARGSESAAEKLFTSVYTLFRNPRAHEELNLTREEDIRCFVLINELFLLESRTK